MIYLKRKNAKSCFEEFYFKRTRIKFLCLQDRVLLNYDIANNIVLIINTFMCLSCPLNLIIYCGMSKQFRENFYMLFGVWKPYVDPNVITMKSSSVFDNVKCPYIQELTRKNEMKMTSF